MVQPRPAGKLRGRKGAKEKYNARKCIMYKGNKKSSFVNG